MAEDIRVVFIIIAQHLRQMREAKNLDNAARLALSVESTYLYAPLAHRMGLYSIKSELEDLSLKYTDRKTYDFIAHKLNETKRSRDRYIQEFIEPLKARLDQTGLKYEIKGRTKSIHSINNKLKKQQVEFEGIYDLFAIRIILDAPLEQEKAQCWQVYSIVTDMYQPNPKRLKDWLSIPKSNGYESLHITVLGPESKWVEVQIRTRRMDEIAEHGLAAHWKYKGVKEETEFDGWLNSLRESLEDKDVELKENWWIFVSIFTTRKFSFSRPKAISSVCQRSYGTRFCVRHPLQTGGKLRFGQRQRQECPHQICSQKRRSGFHQHVLASVAQAGLAQHRGYVEGQK
jgi:GTP pyrophosphokinase